MGDELRLLLSQCDLDSHADTCCAGMNCLLIEYDGRVVTVSPYHDEYEPMRVKIATVATLWEDPRDGQSYILVIHEALYFGDRLKQTLLNPNQMRANGLIVEDVPRQFDNNSSHSIKVPKLGKTIPLTLNGIISTFTSSKPTWEEYNTLPHIELTSSAPWDPNSVEYAEREEKCVGSVRTQDGRSLPDEPELPEADNLNRHVHAVHSFFNSREITGISEDDDDFNNRLADKVMETDSELSKNMDGLAERLISQINVAADDPTGDGIDGMKDEVLYPPTEDMRRVKSLSTKERSSVLTPQVLAKRWNCNLNAANRTMRSTTQAGIRNIYAPGERKLRQRLDHLRYPNLKGKWYSDTWFAKVTSVRQYTCGQVFTNGLGFDISFPLKKKGDAALGLDSFIQQVGIPQTLITDNAKEETQGDWLSTCRKYRIRMEQTIPHSQWRNLAEASVRELKYGVQRATRRSGSPR